MRHDIQPNERAYTTKEAAAEVGIATPTVRKYGQVLERNGYEFFKDGDRRIFVRSDIESLKAIRDTERPLDDTAKDLAGKQKERLETPEDTGISVPDTYDTSLQDPEQLRDFLQVIASELAASREMNVQLTNDMAELRTTVSRLQQDHHVISSGVGNFSKKTHTRIEKLSEQQKAQYEELLQQEKERSEALREELITMREEQKKEWQAQNDFNQRLEKSVQQKPQGGWGKLLAFFRG
ncbi:hypothetical protein GCM10010954_16260 [Halobacillus andaensis]|uniref:HTH merR-type domain-containing protein n=1 Tax=Halobacillus andaensis TaxID=1176239 RepID=A0A917EUY5_HALAA|nr:hypothetical protein [Halobacillus andaensis]MBP2004872.1 DNA-binding transcriptional regulator YhcF (GntR family) [Halobacillus andaensis]GGF18268.1 hypothetical protein GCM10010954_16260 [Halobacillus andaensis]